MKLRIHLLDVARESRIMTHQAEIQHQAMVDSDDFKTLLECSAWLQWLMDGLKPVARLIEDYVGEEQPLAAFNQMHNMSTINALRNRDMMETLHANIFLPHQNPLINPSSSYGVQPNRNTDETNRITAPAPGPHELQVLAS
jgi:hypothetical protein